MAHKIMLSRFKLFLNYRQSYSISLKWSLYFGLAKLDRRDLSFRQIVPHLTWTCQKWSAISKHSSLGTRMLRIFIHIRVTICRWVSFVMRRSFINTGKSQGPLPLEVFIGLQRRVQVSSVFLFPSRKQIRDGLSFIASLRSNFEHYYKHIYFFLS